MTNVNQKAAAQSLYYKCREAGMSHPEALNAVINFCMTGEYPVFKVAAIATEGKYTYIVQK